MEFASGDAIEIPELVKGIEAFLEREVRRRHDEHGDLLGNPRRRYQDDGRHVPEVVALVRDVRIAAADAGYYTMFVPSELGGAGLGLRVLYEVWEAIYRWCGPELWLGTNVVSHWAKGPSHILAQLTDAAREEVMPPLMRGETSLCFAMSEPDAGSDVWMMQTTAIPLGDGDDAGDGWRISGLKQWISNAAYAEHALVFAVTDPEAARQRQGGISAFIVPTDAPGFSVPSIVSLYGELGGDETVVFLDDVVVGPDQVVGQLHHGLDIGLSGIAGGRLYNSAKAVGLAGWALAKGLEHVAQRKTFGRRLADHQGVMFPLVESVMEIHAARLLAQHAADLADAGSLAIPHVSMAKAYATEAAVRATDRVIQAHGATGFTNELHLTDAHRQARRICVADGTSEILRRQLGKALLRGDLSV